MKLCRAALCALSAFSTIGGATTGQEAHPPVAAAMEPLPPRRPIAGLPGLFCVSEIRYVSAPDRPHRMEVTFSFPGRARCYLTEINAPTGARVGLYLRGERGFMVPAETAQSVELLGAKLDQLRMQLALRQATLLWPDGFAWTGEGNERTTNLGTLGRLVAALDSNGRPQSIHSEDAVGRELERYAALTWKVRGSRTFPASTTFEVGGESVWNEEFQTIETAVHVVDTFFLPVDRRQVSVGRAGPASRVQGVDVPTVVVRRVELKATDWAGAVDQARSARASVSRDVERLGLQLEEGCILELSESARPVQCVLRLTESRCPPPEGWSVEPGSAALSLAVARPDEITPDLIAAVAALAPEGEHLATPYVRLGAKTPDGKEMLQLVLALRDP